MATMVNIFLVGKLYDIHCSEFQPLFYNSLPYGDSDSFNEKITWDSSWSKTSYRMMTKIFLENNSIMTKAYVLQALKYVADEEDHAIESDTGDYSECDTEDMKSQLIPEIKSQLIH